MSNDQPTPDVETVLAAHTPLYESDGDYGELQWIECSCGSEYYVDTPADEAEHRAHLAAVLEPLIREREAKAWDEALIAVERGVESAQRAHHEHGHRPVVAAFAGLRMAIPRTENPYRAATHREQP